MNRKSERLAKRIEKAGIRASMREGHILSVEELRKMKIQILPNPLRAILCVFGVALGIMSYFFFSWDNGLYGVLFALLSVLSISFGTYGVRRTLSKILDSMDSGAGEILGIAIDGMIAAVGSIFDAV